MDRTTLDNFRFELLDSVPRLPRISIVQFEAWHDEANVPKIYGTDWICVDPHAETITVYRWDEGLGRLIVSNGTIQLSDSALAELVTGNDMVIALNVDGLPESGYWSEILAFSCQQHQVALSLSVSIQAPLSMGEITDIGPLPSVPYVDGHFVCTDRISGYDAIGAIVELITNNSVVAVDFNDVRAVLADARVLHVVQASAKGEHRVEKALRSLFEQMPPDYGIKRAALIMHGGDAGVSLDEWSEASEYAERRCHEDGIYVCGITLNTAPTDILTLTLCVSQTPYRRVRQRVHKGAQKIGFNDLEPDIPAFLRESAPKD